MMKITTISKLVLACTLAVFSFQSCDTQGSSVASNTSLNLVKQLLTSSTNQGFSILGDTKAFLTNALIEAVMPDELKSINTKLQNAGLGSLVEKEKQYIGKAAEASVDVAKPIITSAIQEMTISDAVSILSGGKGAATQYLKNKTQDKLIAAIQPQVESQLNSNGVTTLINNATKDKTLQTAIGLILGNKQTTSTDVSGSISQYASKQIVDGLFEVAKDYEVKNSSLGTNILNSVLGGGSN